MEITGDPTELYEVSQHKRLPRVETDTIRGGMALVLTEGPSLKAEKVWKQLQKWGKDFGLDNWDWLKAYIELKHNTHSTKTTPEEKVSPIDSYLTDIVAGRPVLSYPMVKGGFRIRYGRSRLTGLAATAIHPATMAVLNDYLAAGTQVKTERPGKATVLTICDAIDGPIVRMEDGSVLQLSDYAKAKSVRNKISEILFLGDILISYGDFSESGQRLVPAGYCEEWWALDVEKLTGNKAPILLSAKEATDFAEQTKTPLHPKWTYFWKDITKEQFDVLFNWIQKLNNNTLPLEEYPKRLLELIGCPHSVNDDSVILAGEEIAVLKYLLCNKNSNYSGSNGLECINSISPITVRDKAGTYIGTRMGRPEKAKIRALKGAPAGLFPIGKEGGRFRSLNEASANNKITSDFPIFNCMKCNKITIYPSCEVCGEKTELWRLCPMCKRKTKKLKCHTDTLAYERRSIEPNYYIQSALGKLQMHDLPQLVKGVKGTWNKDHILENAAKVILRAKHKLTANKDGTIRFDAIQLPITHFKPFEIGASIEKLKSLGYSEDIHNKPLENENQILEIKPQDVLLPICPTSPDESAADIFIRTANFVDELLEKFYGLPKFYNVKAKEDLIGQLMIGLAPHTSCGITARVIGFSQAQAIYAHPYLHAAMRRNCDGDETCVMLALDAFLNFSRQFLPDRRGGRSMDAPLVLTTLLVPEEVDTEAHGLDTAFSYPLEFYLATQEYKYAWEVKVEQVKDRLRKESQYEGLGFTHDTTDMNAGVLCSAYKTLPTMFEKLAGQLELASKIRAVKVEDVATLVIDKHFLRDIKGNLRGFTTQE
ncbi:MAG TPA: DNA polymerase II large subunit, partial [Candidatus Nanoarchaeia archaeon]|nr:DNA polymerase II large subunit [Candidatus Nanoarchaeia archaeon]